MHRIELRVKESQKDTSLIFPYAFPWQKIDKYMMKKCEIIYRIFSPQVYVFVVSCNEEDLANMLRYLPYLSDLNVYINKK